jgi:hypothetical protein
LSFKIFNYVNLIFNIYCNRRTGNMLHIIANYSIYSITITFCTCDKPRSSTKTSEGRGEPYLQHILYYRELLLKKINKSIITVRSKTITFYTCDISRSSTKTSEERGEAAGLAPFFTSRFNTDGNNILLQNYRLLQN